MTGYSINYKGIITIGDDSDGYPTSVIDIIMEDVQLIDKDEDKFLSSIMKLDYSWVSKEELDNPSAEYYYYVEKEDDKWYVSIYHYEKKIKLSIEDCIKALNDEHDRFTFFENLDDLFKYVEKEDEYLIKKYNVKIGE